MLVTTLIATPKAPALGPVCDSDCVQALTVALQWALEKPSKVTAHSDPKRTALDIEPRTLQRPPDAIDPDEEVATLRQIANALGIEVVKRSDDEANQICSQGWTKPACRVHWGRTLISVGEFKFTSIGKAEVWVRINIFGDAMLGGSGGPYYYSLSTCLMLEKAGGGWKVTGQGLTIVS